MTFQRNQVFLKKVFEVFVKLVCTIIHINNLTEWIVIESSDG
jgi:hypothetical protein